MKPAHRKSSARSPWLACSTEAWAVAIPGTGTLVQVDFFTDLQTVRLWGTLGGFGDPYSRIKTLDESTAHKSEDLTNPANEPKVWFNTLYCSYIWEWYKTDNLMRATLATSTYGLASMWRAFPIRLDSLALGEPLATGLREALNEQDSNGYGPVYLALMGDPTLRLKY